MPGTVNLTENENVKQHVYSPRKVLIVEPIDWVLSLPYSWKNDRSQRVYLNSSHLNTALERLHRKIPTTEVLTYHFAGAKIFSKFDTKANYFHLDIDSQLQIIFQFLYRRYCFQRRTFEFSISPDILQMKMD